ncbi:MAG TPA: hypothetical protein VN758_02865 [Solirubrobacterales bacterium]|nr:hypothetical protein [Solirubrobacterales bacterium]
MDAVSQQGQLLVGHRSPQGAQPERTAPGEANSERKQRIFRLPLLRGRSGLTLPLDRASRDERAEEREREKRLVAVEAAEQAFYRTPAGRARLAYRRGHRLFQYELEINELPPTVVPGLAGAPALVTTDPVDILNSVTVEGWKLVTGKFIHSEMRNGAVGCYLFKRSQKRRLSMNNPWQDPRVVS